MAITCCVLLLQAISDWGLETQQPEPALLPRVVIHSSSIRYPMRLWADLGADLHILKLSSPLPKWVGAVVCVWPTVLGAGPTTA